MRSGEEQGEAQRQPSPRPVQRTTRRLSLGGDGCWFLLQLTCGARGLPPVRVSMSPYSAQRSDRFIDLLKSGLGPVGPMGPSPQVGARTGPVAGWAQKSSLIANVLVVNMSLWLTAWPQLGAPGSAPGTQPPLTTPSAWGRLKPSPFCSSVSLSAKWVECLPIPWIISEISGWKYEIPAVGSMEENCGEDTKCGAHSPSCNL